MIHIGSLIICDGVGILIQRFVSFVETHNELRESPLPLQIIRDSCYHMFTASFVKHKYFC